MFIVFTNFLFCMDMVSGKTKIILIRDFIYNRHCSSDANITVVGVREQMRLKPGSLSDPGAIGDVFKSKKNTVEIKNVVFEKYFNYKTEKADNEPQSIIVDGQEFDIQNSYKYVETKSLSGHLALIVEPIVTRSSWNLEYTYHPKRRLSENRYTDPDYYGNEAIEEAQKDLGLCYKNILEKVHKFFTIDDVARSIAFPQISESLPRDKAVAVAVASVLQFLRDSINKDAYKVIEFVVSQKADFELYMSILDQHFLSFHKKKVVMAEKADFDLYDSVFNPVELTYLFTNNGSKK